MIHLPAFQRDQMDSTASLMSHFGSVADTRPEKRLAAQRVVECVLRLRQFDRVGRVIEVAQLAREIEQHTGAGSNSKCV
jgi:hypothetical protein